MKEVLLFTDGSCLNNPGPGGFGVVLSYKGHIKELSEEHSLKEHSKNPSYLYHNGRPLVAVWGVGFNDHRKYGIDEAQTIINGLKKLGFSIMLGVPTHWHFFLCGNC